MMHRNNCYNMKGSEMNKIIIGMLLVGLSVVCLALTTELAAQSSNKSHDAIKDKIEKTPDISMKVERSEVPPLGIQEAKVKSISRFDYADLT